MSAGRNDPCPCGSGKKYEKCCMDNVVSFDSPITRILEKVPTELYGFAQDRYETEIYKLVDEQLEGLDIRKEQEELLYILFLTWFIFYVPVDAKATILDLFIDEKEKSKAIRSSVLKQLKTWRGTNPSFAVMTEALDERLIEVKDIFTMEKKKVKLDEEEGDVEAGDLLFGYLLPYGSYHAYLPIFLDFPSQGAQELILSIYEEEEASGYEEPGVFLSEFFPDYIKLMILGNNQRKQEDMEWNHPLHEKVAVTYEAKVEELGEYPHELAELGTFMWKIYCDKVNPSLRKPDVYAAALHYFVDVHLPSVGIYTQKELGDVYGVSPAAVSKAYRKLEEVLPEELKRQNELIAQKKKANEEEAVEQPFNRMEMEKSMREATKALEEKDFDSMEELSDEVHEPVNETVSGRDPGEASPQVQAQDLLYEAYQKTGQDRIKLAEKVLDLDPQNPDAFNLLGDEEPNPAEAIKLFEKGMEAGEKQLGNQFFEEFKGHFWGFAETRPYMRAKYNYTFALIRLGRLEEAIKQMEELLELNTMDNQGVRDSLFAAYVVTGAYQNAKQLLDEYSDSDLAMASGAFNRVLIEYYLNGISSNIKKLLKKAKKVNPYVIDYLVGKKTLPDHLPDSFQPGDEKEAVIYAAEHIVLWEKEAELLEWLKKRG